MVRISFTPVLKRHLDCPTAEAEGSTVREVLESVFQRNGRLRRYLLDDQGRLRHHVQVFVRGELIEDRDGLSDAVADGDDLVVMQALSGG
jgi:molybdopterin converting factor small subunit